MTVKVGDKVKYTGKTKLDLTQGKIYEVIDIYKKGSIRVLDDAGDGNSFISCNYEPIAEEPNEYDYATQAPKQAADLGFNWR